LLTHTAGLGYAFLDQDVLHYLAFAGMPAQGSIASIATPLMFDPGSDWAYSIATDWVGLAVQNASGETLGDYLKRHIFGPLGMHSSGFRAHKLDGDASVHRRLPGGGFATDPIALRGEEYEIGGGGLVSTARDYGRFLQAMLRGGELDGNRLIQNATFEEMTKPQTGTLRAGRMDSIMPELSGTFDMFPDQHTAWSLGFLVNPEEGPDGRAAGSQSWAGIFNSYYWFDRETDRAGFFTAQLLPFADERAINAFRALERLAYS
jgi:CubicO group peptidase (beta-lactamase class C family)